MGTKSTNDDVCSQQLRDKVAESWVAEQLKNPEKIPELLEEIARDGWTGFRDCDDQKVFRHAMMYGLIDEDTGEDR